MAVGAGGKHGDIAVLLDAHGKFGADETQALGAHMPAEQAQAGDANFRFRRACDHGAVGIAHDDVANTHGGAAIRGAFDLRAADFYPLAAAEVFLDGSDQPRSESVNLNRSGREPPPQSGATKNQQADKPAAADREAPDKPPMPRQQAAISGKVTAVAPALAAMGRRKAGPAPRMNGAFAPSRRRSDLPILVGHTRPGVPSSVAPSR